MIRLRTATALLTLTAALAAAPAADAHLAEKAYALQDSNLVTFDPASPATSATTTAITGVAAGETLVGLDVRPVNGMLYAFGVNAMSNAGTLYAIGPKTAYASAVGPAGSVAFTTDGATPVDFPDPAVVDYGFSASPIVSTFRVTTATGLNFRINANTGAPVDGSAVAGTNPDQPIAGAVAGVGGIAYTNSGTNQATATTVYALNTASHALTIQNPPNNGVQIAEQALTLGGAPLAATDIGGFDLDPAVTVASNNTAATSGDGYAILTVAGIAHLYKIALTTATATDLGPIGAGTGPFRGLALPRDLADGGFPAVGLAASHTSLRRLLTGTPDTAVDVAVTGMTASETLVGVAWRPATGALLGLGINATNNTGTLYNVDPSGGGATAIGTPGQIALVGSGGTEVDLPDAALGWGIDVNPTADRVRVVASGGLNFRVNPVTGAPVDGDGVSAGTQPDGNHNGLPLGATGLAAVAYTNAYTQPLIGGVTTVYVLEPTSNQLMIQSPPNLGTLTAGRTVTLGGAPLDFAAGAGLDIPGEVSVTTANTSASGEALAALVVGGTPGLYRIDLATGAATLIGATPSALASLAVGEAVRGTPAPPPGDDGADHDGDDDHDPAPVPPAPPSPPAQPLPLPGTPLDTTRPVVTKLAVKARTKRRLMVTFVTSEKGTATIELQSVRKGRKQGRKCVKGRKTGARCAIYKTYKKVTKNVAAGKATVAITGRTGAVRVLVTVTDTAKNRSAAATKSATVKR